MRNFLVGVLAVVLAAPVAAASFSAFPSFNGVNGNGRFTYGYSDGVTATAFDFSGTDGACALGSGSTCLYATSLGNLPQASVGGSFPTVQVPANAILLHPGNSDTQSVYGAFKAGVTSTYTYTIDLQSVGIDTTNGIGYTPFTSVGGVVTRGTRGVLATYLSTASLTGSKVLVAGQSFGVIVDRNGFFAGDSTGFNFSISAVPEPATWGLMIAGFAMVGAAARRRRVGVSA